MTVFFFAGQVVAIASGRVDAAQAEQSKLRVLMGAPPAPDLPHPAHENGGEGRGEVEGGRRKGGEGRRGGEKGGRDEGGLGQAGGGGAAEGEGGTQGGGGARGEGEAPAERRSLIRPESEKLATPRKSVLKQSGGESGGAVAGGVEGGAAGGGEGSGGLCLRSTTS